MSMLKIGEIVMLQYSDIFLCFLIIAYIAQQLFCKRSECPIVVLSRDKFMID